MTTSLLYIFIEKMIKSKRKIYECKRFWQLLLSCTFIEVIGKNSGRRNPI